MQVKEVKLTPEGYARIQKQLEQEQQRLAEATRILQEQMETNSDTEDTGLEDAKREKLSIEARIDELEDTLLRAKVIEGNTEKGNTIALGSVVALYMEATKKDLQVQVVSAAEAAVAGGTIRKVSEDSPVGKELLGRKKGESFVVNLENGKQVKYKIKAVE